MHQAAVYHSLPVRLLPRRQCCCGVKVQSSGPSFAHGCFPLPQLLPTGCSSSTSCSAGRRAIRPNAAFQHPCMTVCELLGMLAALGMLYSAVECLLGSVRLRPAQRRHAKSCPSGTT